jgi:integrase
MKLALLTGMRRSEMFRLKWDHVNFENGFLRIVDPRGGPDQDIPLNPEAVQLLEAHRRTAMGSPYVFPGRNGGQRVTIAVQVGRIKKAAGLPDDFRPLHGLRHYAVNTLKAAMARGQAAQNVLPVLAAYLGHVEYRHTMKYLKVLDAKSGVRLLNFAGSQREDP